jgi:hypothetical protein
MLLPTRLSITAFKRCQGTTHQQLTYATVHTASLLPDAIL